jgi:hypothetical protein
MGLVTRQIGPNRLDIVLRGDYGIEDIEHLALDLLREAAGLQYGFGVTVDATELHLEDPSVAPILAKVFGSLQWFGISHIEHQGTVQGLDFQMRTLYGDAGLLGSVPLQIDTLDSIP